MTDTNKTVLIPHVSADADKAQELIGPLSDRGFNVLDCLVDDPDNDEAAIRSEVDKADAVIVPVTPNINGNELVDLAVKCAYKKEIQIIGPMCEGSGDDDMSDALSKYADSTPAWKTMKEVLLDARCWEDSFGNARPDQPTPRFKCRPKKKKRR